MAEETNLDINIINRDNKITMTDNEPQPMDNVPTPQPPPPRQGPTTTIRIPSLNSPHMSLSFGRLDSDYTVVEHVLSIDNQDTLSGLTYDQLAQLLTIDPAINRNDFIRMWKSLILKRTHDVFAKVNGIQPPNYIPIHRGISLPGPLADLLHGLGVLHSDHTGHYHTIVSPPRPNQNPPNWWNIDLNIIRDWNQTMSRLPDLYTLKQFPNQGDYEQRPLMLTNIVDEEDLRVIHAWTNEPKPIDALTRMVNDDLFAAHPYITSANSSLTMTPATLVSMVRTGYIGSYVINSNS